MKQETVWDTIAEKWHEYRNEPPDYVKNFLKDKEGRILDLCCGSGRNFSQIKVFVRAFSQQFKSFSVRL